jgi:quinol monooxygenase YgiN
MSNDAISWVFEATIKPHSTDEYVSMALDITKSCQAEEPGQEIFEWFVNDHDVQIYERYSNSATALFHVERFVANFATHFLSLCTPTRMSVYGSPSADLKQALTGFNPRYYSKIAGHAR